MGETEESSKCGRGDRVSGGKEPKIRKIRRANLSLGQNEAFAGSLEGCRQSQRHVTMLCKSRTLRRLQPGDGLSFHLVPGVTKQPPPQTTAIYRPTLAKSTKHLRLATSFFSPDQHPPLLPRHLVSVHSPPVRQPCLRHELATSLFREMSKQKEKEDT